MWQAFPVKEEEANRCLPTGAKGGLSIFRGQAFWAEPVRPFMRRLRSHLSVGGAPRALSL